MTEYDVELTEITHRSRRFTDVIGKVRVLSIETYPRDVRLEGDCTEHVSPSCTSKTRETLRNLDIADEHRKMRKALEFMRETRGSGKR